ncbi:MAG TPA: TMEM175 family protein [Gaiellales bacterium]|nr:TMEM175 family protein [Gaiellales bacterium]
MSRRRLEAFSDGVIAVIITIMVLSLHPPAGSSLHDLRPLVPKLAVYLLSFVFVALYWNNHHHLMQVVERINGAALWANAHLLFWLSLIPVATAWLGPHLRESAPVAVYGTVLLGASIAYTILVRTLIASHEPASQIARAVGDDAKGKFSLVAYVAAVAAAPFAPWLSIAIYVAVAITWLVPDRRIERVLSAEAGDRE